MMVLTLCASRKLATVNTPVAGGTGGSPCSLSCGSNKALVGIKDKAGMYIDKVRGVCAQINYDKSWQGDTTTTGTEGGSGENSFNLSCPGGQAVSGFKGRAGFYIDQLKVRCGALGQNGRLSSYGDFLSGSAGGTGGSSFEPYDCSGNQPARLIQGKAATWVDSMGLGCEYVNTLKLNSMSISPSTTRVGQTTSATVTMSLTPAATARVNLTSSNTSVATVSYTGVGTSSTQGTASIRTVTPGCTTITASYKGSSASSDLLVHSAASSVPSITIRATVRLGQATNMTVSLPYNSPVNLPIRLENVDNVPMQIPDQVTINQNGSSASFFVLVESTGCVRIKAADSRTGATVTNAFKVVR